MDDATSLLQSSQTKLSFAKSPLAPQRFIRWLTLSGPKLLAILAAIFIAYWLSRFIGRRFVVGLVRRSRRGSEPEREQRAETLRRVFQTTASSFIFVIGSLAILQQFGFDVTVLLGGAAVLGAALAFGSQNLIKDYFAGFMILSENQYSVGNIIRIAEVSGLVEDITLRVTTLRDEEGVVHFIPHSQITKVSNLTHGWSRAVFKISVAYHEDLDRVMSVMLDVAKQLQDDPDFGPHIIDDPELLGVDELSQNAKIPGFRQWNECGSGDTIDFLLNQLAQAIENHDALLFCSARVRLQSRDTALVTVGDRLAESSDGSRSHIGSRNHHGTSRSQAREFKRGAKRS